MASEKHPVIDCYSLAIGIITIYDEHSHELIAHEDQITKEEVEAYKLFVKEHLKKPLRIFVNKQNKYSYEFEALEVYTHNSPHIVYALVAYDKADVYSFESAISFSKHAIYSVFDDKDKALDWLLSYPVDQIL